MQVSDKIIYRKLEELQDHGQNGDYNSELTPREEASLKASIVEVGIQDALLVRSDGTVISGHQRKRIAHSLGMTEVPTLEVECTDEEALYLLVATNEARRGDEKDLIKKAHRVKVLYEKWGIRPGRKSVHDAQFSRHDVAASLKLDDSSVRRLLKLLYLIPELQREVSGQSIGLIGGNKIAALDPERQREFYKLYQIAGGSLNMKGIEKLIEQIDAPEVIKTMFQEKKQQQLVNKVEKLKKDLIWLMTEQIDNETRSGITHLLETYAVRLKGGEYGENDD